MKKTLQRIILGTMLATLPLNLGCEDDPETPKVETAWVSLGSQLYTGKKVSGTAKLTKGYGYSGYLRYSNDDFENIDNISVFVNGSQVLKFHPRDTGDWGFGWANYVNSSKFSFTAPEEENTFEVRANKTDSYGFRPDGIHLEHYTNTVNKAQQ